MFPLLSSEPEPEPVAAVKANAQKLPLLGVGQPSDVGRPSLVQDYVMLFIRLHNFDNRTHSRISIKSVFFSTQKLDDLQENEDDSTSSTHLQSDKESFQMK